MRIAIRRYRYLIAACALGVVTVAGLGAFGVAQANAADATELAELTAGQLADADEEQWVAEDVPAKNISLPDETEVPEQEAGKESGDDGEPRLVAGERAEGESSSSAATEPVEEPAPGTRMEEAGEGDEDGSWNSDEGEDEEPEEPYAAAAAI